MAAALSMDSKNAGEGPGMVCPAEAKGDAPDVELCRRMDGKTVLQGRQSVFVGIHGSVVGFPQEKCPPSGPFPPPFSGAKWEGGEVAGRAISYHLLHGGREGWRGRAWSTVSAMACSRRA